MASAYRFEFLGIYQLSVQQGADGEWHDLAKPATVKAQSLLAYLVMNRQRPCRRERLAGMFWGDSPDRKARQSLATALWHIRHVFADKSLIHSDAQTIQFNPQANIWVDVDAFDAYLSGDSAADWQTAVNLYRGDFLETFYDDWIITERYTYQERFYEALAQLMTAYENGGALPKAQTSAERLLSPEPLREDAHRLLMRVYSKLGQPDRALRQYRRCREVVLAELNVEPMTETTDLYQAILEDRFLPQPAKQITSIDQLAAGEPAAGDPPFKGLQFFDVTDADLFYGRDTVVKQLVDQFLNTNFLAVVGASGSGKSSVVRAGLIPTLQTNHEYTHHLITPTAHPLRALASVSAGGDDTAVNTKQLLVIDQFEELFTLCRNESERNQFLQQLVTAVTQSNPPWKIIIVLRADFYAHCAEYEGLRTLLARHQTYIGPMTTNELRQVIEQPVLQNSWQIAPGLADLILRDMGDEPGALPLLSHALLETWQRRRGRTLTLAGYTDAGGVFGAIAKTADHVFHELSPEQQQLAQSIFLRLTELGEGTQDTRRRVSLDELIPQKEGRDDVDVVLRRLTDARLIVTAADTAEVAHEALIREWPALRRWLNNNREGLRIHHQLTDSAQEWERLARDDGALYRGARLSEAQAWFDTQQVPLNALEYEFLRTSIAFAQKQITEQEAQRQRELRAAQQLARTQTESAQKLRRRAWMLVGVTAVALLLALWALFNRQQAIQNAAQAETQQQIAASRELAAAALNTLTIDPELSVLLALQAVALTDTIEAQTALHQTLPALNLRQTLRGHEDLIQGLSISADGTKIATAAIDNTVRLWDPVRGDLLLTLADVHHDPMAVAFHPGGDQLLTSGLADGQAALWQLAEGGENGVTAALIYTVEVGASGIVAAAFSPDGSKIAVGLNDGTIKMLQAESGAALWQSPGHTPQPATTIIGVLGVTDVAFHPNGSLLAASGTDGAITLWDVANGERLASVTEDRSVMALDFSADGAQLAAAGEDGTVKAWQVDPETQALTIDLVLATEATDVAFSADGRFLATASGAGFSTLWEVASGRRVQDFFGHSGAVMELKFMPDSTQLVTASEDKTIKLWDLVPGREWMTVMGAMNPAFTPDGRFLATTDPAGALTLWERETGRAAQQLPLSELPLNAVAFSADGSLVAGTAVDNSVTIRTFPALEPVLAIPPQPVRVWHVQFSPTAATAAVSNELGVVQLWDMVAGEVLFTWQASMGPVSQLSFSPDGALVATGGWDGAVALWDTASGTQVAARQLDVEALDVAFSPDGGRLAVADRSGGIAVWPVGALEGPPLAAMTGHTSGVTGVLFTGNGRQLATISFDGTLRLWDADTGQERLLIDSPENNLVFLDISPDGAHLVTGSLEGIVRGYVLDLDALIALAQDRVPRSLTDAECRRFLYVDSCPGNK